MKPTSVCGFATIDIVWQAFFSANISKGRQTANRIRIRGYCFPITSNFVTKESAQDSTPGFLVHIENGVSECMLVRLTCKWKMCENMDFKSILYAIKRWVGNLYVFSDVILQIQFSSSALLLTYQTDPPICNIFIKF